MNNRNTTIILTSFVAGAILPFSAFGQNLLTNGNFSSGNAGFTTTYVYSPGNIVSDTTYDVVANPQLSQPAGASFGDHTTGTGLMLAANGSLNTNDIVWSETVNVATNKQYVFSGWGATWGNAGQNFDPNPPAIRILINGAQKGGIGQLLPTNGLWQNFTALWDSQSSTQAVIELHLASTAFVGNDLALDDLSLALATNPPAAVRIYQSVDIEWDSLPNLQYQVQWASSVSSDTWFDLGPPVVATTTNSFIGDRAVWNSRFYRVLSLQ